MKTCCLNTHIHYEPECHYCCDDEKENFQVVGVTHWRSKSKHLTIKGMCATEGREKFWILMITAINEFKFWKIMNYLKIFLNGLELDLS